MYKVWFKILIYFIVADLCILIILGYILPKLYQFCVVILQFINDRRVKPSNLVNDDTKNSQIEEIASDLEIIQKEQVPNEKLDKLIGSRWLHQRGITDFDIGSNEFNEYIILNGEKIIKQNLSESKVLEFKTNGKLSIIELAEFSLGGVEISHIYNGKWEYDKQIMITWGGFVKRNDFYVFTDDYRLIDCIHLGSIDSPIKIETFINAPNFYLFDDNLSDIKQLDLQELMY